MKKQTLDLPDMPATPAYTKQPFRYHSAVESKWFHYAQSLAVRCWEADGTGIAWQAFPFLFDAKDITEDTPERRTAEKFTLLPDGRSIRSGVRVNSDSEMVDHWIRIGHGHTRTGQTTWPRQLIETAGPVQLVLATTGGPVGHGQCEPATRWRFNFQAMAMEPMSGPRRRAPGLLPPPYFSIPNRPDWLRFGDAVWSEPDAFDESEVAPAFPGRTGDQENFGLTHLLRDLYQPAENLGQMWFSMLRNEACRPGHFVHPNGAHVYDDTADTNRLIYDAGVGFDARCDGYESQAWFKPADTLGVARTSKGTRWRGWDRQHWGAAPLCQAVWIYDDLALLWEVEDMASNWLFSNNSEERGTTHHQQTNARGNGRSLQSGANIMWVLLERDPVSAAKVHKRLLELLRLQVTQWDQIGVIVKRGYASLWMHAEWVNGLAACVHLTMPAELLADVIRIGQEIARWVLKGFKLWYGGHWAVPYKVDAEARPISDKPSNGLSTWCIASLQLLLLPGASITPAEAAKARLIVDQYVTDRAPDYRGGLPRWMEWLAQ